MSSNAFAPHGNTAVIDATSTSTATPIQVKGDIANATQRLITNKGPNDAYLAWGMDTTLVCAIPTAGTPANGLIIEAGAIISLSYPPNASFAAVCASGQTAKLFITPGEGV